MDRCRAIDRGESAGGHAMSGRWAEAGRLLKYLHMRNYGMSGKPPTISYAVITDEANYGTFAPKPAAEPPSAEDYDRADETLRAIKYDPEIYSPGAINLARCYAALRQLNHSPYTEIPMADAAVKAALRIMAAGWSLGGTCEDDEHIVAAALAAAYEAEADVLVKAVVGVPIHPNYEKARWLCERAAELRSKP